MKLTQPCGTVLPIHASFYGEILVGDLAWFVSAAQAALKACGFRLIKTIGPKNSDSEQEFWANSDQLTVEGQPPVVLGADGEDAALKLNWIEITHLFNAEEIQSAIEEAYMSAS